MTTPNAIINNCINCFLVGIEFVNLSSIIIATIEAKTERPRPIKIGQDKV